MIHYGGFPLLTHINWCCVDGKTEMAWEHKTVMLNPVIKVNIELQQHLVEYLTTLVRNTQITSHKRATCCTATPRAPSLLGSTDHLLQNLDLSWQDLTCFRANARDHTTTWQRVKCQKQHSAWIHCDSSQRGQNNMFCILCGEWLIHFFRLFFFLSLLFSISLSPCVSVHIPWKAFHAWAKFICLSSAKPHCPPHGLIFTSFEFF